MENEENGPREPGSLDANLFYEQTLRSTENSTKMIEAVQVSSLTLDDREQPTKSPKESIDVDFMSQQLSEKYKEASENWSEKGKQIEEGCAHPGVVSPEENEIYRKALMCVPKDIIQIRYLHQLEIAKILNEERADRRDFRLVADNLNFPMPFIITASQSQNPMMTIFEHSGNLKGIDLVEALFKCKRFDAMKCIVNHYFSDKLMHSISQEERQAKFKEGSAVTGSLEERLLSGDRFRAASDPQEQSQTDASSTEVPCVQAIQLDSTPHEEPHYCEDDADWTNAVPRAREFWDRISSEQGTESKKLKNVSKAFKAMFETGACKSEFPYIWKLITHTFEVAGNSDDLVSPEKYRQMLAFFGSPTAEPDGCIRVAGELRIRSQRKLPNGKNKISWFAGRMDQTEVGRLLEDKDPGTFLVRFSTSHADDGWFVLAIKTEKAGVAQFQIEQTQSDERRVFRISAEQREFSSLWNLIEYYEVNPVVDEDEEISEYLERPCPGLPLNAICTGYKKGKGKK